MTRTILITGASSGIGLELAKQFAEKGNHVLALARSKDKLQALADTNENVTPVPFDIGERDKIDAFVAKLVKSYPELSILINNAGIQGNVRVDDPAYSNAHIANEININLTAPICLSRALLPHFAAQDKSRIVNVTSGLAYIPKLTSAVYSATKSGLHLYSEGLRVQMKETGVAISEIILPMVETPMTEGRGSGKISAASAARQIIAGMEAGRDRIYVGKTKALPLLIKFLPGLARTIIQKT